MKKPVCFFLIALFLLFYFTAAGFAENGARLTIYYSASLNGNLDGCDCKEVPRAGFVKRAAFLSSKEKKRPSLLVDAGDILDSYPDPLLANYLLKAYSEMGYDTVAVGDQEFANGYEMLPEYQEQAPFLSENLWIRGKDGRMRLLSERPVIVHRGGLSVGVIALIDPDVFKLYDADVRENIVATDPEQTARKAVKSLEESGAQVILLLYHGYWEHAETLVRIVGGIDAAVVGHEQLLKDAVKIGGTVMVSPGERGNRLGILSLTVQDGAVTDYTNRFRLFSYKYDPDDPYIRKMIDQYMDEMRSSIKTIKETN